MGEAPLAPLRVFTSHAVEGDTGRFAAMVRRPFTPSRLAVIPVTTSSVGRLTPTQEESASSRTKASGAGQAAT